MIARFARVIAGQAMVILVAMAVIAWLLIAPPERAEAGPEEWCGTCMEGTSKIAWVTPPELMQGEKLFKGNCAACHDVFKKTVGPALAGATERVPEGDWIYDWVRNSRKMIEAGDPYAVGLYNEYQQPMTAMPYLTNEDIDAIFDYVNARAETTQLEAVPTQKGSVP